MLAEGPLCLPRERFAVVLAERWGERALWGGVSQAGLLTQGYVNPSTGTWSIAVTTPQGVTCLVAGGLAFEVYALPAVAPGVPG